MQHLNGGERRKQVSPVQPEPSGNVALKNMAATHIKFLKSCPVHDGHM